MKSRKGFESEKEEEYTSNYELDIQKVKFNSEIWLKLFVLTTAIGGLGSQDQCWSSTIMDVGLARKYRDYENMRMIMITTTHGLKMMIMMMMMGYVYSSCRAEFRLNSLLWSRDS